MSESILPNVRAFDLGAILQGRSFPELEVPFYLDEAAALKLSRRERLVNRLDLLGKEDEAKEMAEEIESLKQAIKDSRYVYYLRGISNKARQDLLKKATDQFPKERDFLGNVQENDERDELFTALLWHAMSIKIEAPDGSVQLDPSYEQVQSFRELLPTSALSAIQDGINELTMGAKAGFESAVQDSDFLSQP